MRVRKGTITDLDEVLELESRIYPEQWQVSKEYAQEVLARNDEILRVLDVNGNIKGHYAFIPLKQEIYEKVLNGLMDEKELAEYTLKYNESKDVFLYWLTIIVDIKDPNRRELSRSLISDIPRYLQQIRESGINIVEIGGIFISEEGERVARRFGMRQTGAIDYIDGKSYPIYRTSQIQ